MYFGAYAIRQQWPAKGHWVLAIGLQGHDGPSMMVEMGPDGGVTSTRYYEETAKEITLGSVRVLTGGIDAARIETALKGLAEREVRLAGTN